VKQEDCQAVNSLIKNAAAFIKGGCLIKSNNTTTQMEVKVVSESHIKKQNLNYFMDLLFG
jgi:hypothetical protein